MQRILALVLAFLIASPSFADIDVRGELKNAKLEKLSSAPTGSEARTYYNTTTKKPQFYNGTSWQDVGSGSGGGFTDQITNGGAEDASVPSGWGTFNDGAVAAPIDGTGGTASQITSIARDTTAGNLINGSAVWKFVKSAANAQGQGWSYAFTPPANWSGKNSLVSLTFNYFMSTASGDDVRVYLYDVTNSTLITPSFVTCGGGTAPKLTGTTSVCQAKLAFVSTTATSYRLVFHVATTLTTAMNLFVDDISITDGRAQPGQNVGPWTAYTPTFSASFGTTSGLLAQYRRVGDSLEVSAFVTSGTLTAAVGSISIPSGLTINTANLQVAAAIAGSTGGNVGNFTSDSTAGTIGNTGSILVSSTSNTAVYIGGAAASTSGTTLTARYANMNSYTSTSAFSIRFTVPINEWAGGTSFGENNVAFASNSDTSNTTNSSSFAYGPAGSLVPASNPAAAIYKEVDVGNIQAGDMLFTEVSSDRVNWSSPGTVFSDSSVIEIYKYNEAGSNPYGISQPQSTGTAGRARVYFGIRTSFNGGSWGGKYWRIHKISSGVAVPFGLATSSTPGLHQVGAVPGMISGTAVATGNVGERVVGTLTATSTTGVSTPITVTSSISLGAGMWQLFYSGSLYFNGTPTAATAVAGSAYFQNDTDVASLTVVEPLGQNSATVAGGDSGNVPVVLQEVVNNSGSKSYSVRFRSVAASGSPATGGVGSRTTGIFYAVRIQ